MKSDLIMAINQICAEKELPRAVILKAVEDALVSAYRRNYASNNAVVLVNIDPDTGDMHIFCQRTIVEDVQDPSTEISLAEAQGDDPTAVLGGVVSIERTPADFGRIAAQTAKQVILQRIHEAERDALFDYYHEREGELITGTVQTIDYRTNQVTISLGKKAEAALAPEDQLPGERFRIGQTVRTYLAEVHKGTRGPSIRLSRTHRNMLRRLLEREVPEIFNGTVEIKSIAREPGQRSKVAVGATQPGVDPVGSCVGMRGTRIQNIVDELGGERIDVVEWSSDVREYITNALSPAKPSDTLLLEEGDARTAVVIVPDRQLSLAIGKEGQNARLAAKLTGWRIDIKSESEASTEGLSEIKRQQMQLLKVRNLESKATATTATPPPDDLLSRAEWLLRERDKNAMTLDQVARMLADNEPAETEMIGEETPAAEVTETASPEPAAEEITETAAEATVEEAQAVEEPAAEAAAPAQAAPGIEEEMAVPPYEEFDVEPESEEEEEGKAGQKGKGKSKKTAKKRELVFDEDLGQVVAVRKRKGSRGGGWGEDY
ncbi:MAG TPA: transcription termination factor NusA [Anaerolineae bacterium]